MKRPLTGGKAPATKKREARKPIDFDDILSKKTFAQLKLLRKAVKKGKQFEIQKVVRRLKQAKEATSQNKNDIGKLDKLLSALRAADVDKLANIAAASVGIRASTDGDLSSGSEEGGPSGVKEEEKKILAAKCVVDQLVAMLAAVKTLKTKVERQKQKVGSAVSEEDGDEPASKSISENEEGPSKEEEDHSEEESEKEPDEEALNALSKLLAKRGKKTEHHAGGCEGSSDESEDDSGVIDMDYSDLESDLELDISGSEVSDVSEEPEKPSARVQQQQRQQQQQQPKAKKQPKKPKNRLGQRARRLLAEQAHGKNASHFYKSADKKAGDRDRRPAKQAPQEEEALHPSWAARRQQREKLSISAVPPAGEKIVFDDGKPRKERAEKSGKLEVKAAEGKLHPSWELKKQQKAAQKHLQPAQGKKIVFNDSD